MRRPFAVTVAGMVVAALLVTLSGCSLQVGLDTTVQADGSGMIGVKLAADKALQDALQQAKGSVTSTRSSKGSGRRSLPTSGCSSS
jgi:hypothetical protein